MKKYALILIFLSPIIAELLSGSTPFLTFLNPRVFLIYLGFYGCGCLLIRETVSHRNLGYASVLLLGAAFGVLEEGIILRSWFDPHWMGAQITSQVLRVYGISVLQPFANVVYHAVVSMTAPILVVESVKSRENWLSKGEMGLIFVFFVISGLCLSTFNDYHVRVLHYVLGVGLLSLFVVLGLKITISPGTKVYSPRSIWVLASVFVVLLFVIFYTLSMAQFHWAVILGLALALYSIYGIGFSRIAWRPDLYYAAGAGVITGLLPIVAVMARTAPVKIGNVIATVVTVVILVIIYRRLGKDTN